MLSYFEFGAVVEEMSFKKKICTTHSERRLVTKAYLEPMSQVS